jgi:O-antigen ligase
MIVLMVVAASIFLFLDWTMDLSNVVIGMLGRDASLTSRVPIWQGLREMVVNPFVGAGYQTFWLGDRLETIWEKYGQINQAHNGYLEQYLNLGYIGVAFIGMIMLSGLLKVRRQFNVDYPWAMLRLCFILTAALYNYTEASLYGMSNVWVLLLVSCIEIPEQEDLSKEGHG